LAKPYIMLRGSWHIRYVRSFVMCVEYSLSVVSRPTGL